MNDNSFKNSIFVRVRDRLVNRRDSLELFFDHWHGTAGGVEGWFKVEFASAIEPAIAVVETGGGGGWGKKGTFPDLLLKRGAGNTIPVELKAAGGWWCGGSVETVYRKYSGFLLACLTVSDDPLSSRHRRIVDSLDSEALLCRICKVRIKGKPKAFYFVMADLR